MADTRFNPTADEFAPSSRINSMSAQVSVTPTSLFEARVLNLEEEHVSLRGEISNLKELYHDLSSSVEKLKQGGWPVHVGPFQEVDPNKSNQSALGFKLELERLAYEIRGVTDEKKVNGNGKMNGSVPPHMRATGAASHNTVPKSVPPHLRGTKNDTAVNKNGVQTYLVNNRLVTDGLVDLVFRSPKVSASIHSPLPTPPATVTQPDPKIVKDISQENEWKPYHLTAMQPLPPEVRSKIPVAGMVTFHPDFIHNTFDGITWSPGLRYIHGSAPCILKNRTYYLLDSKTEPFLPSTPGDHGAKLTAFFNRAPEEKFGELPDGANSYEDVPMFVKQGNRYAYFGNYSQTRWSDKLDFDSMKAGVPEDIKTYWADELSAPNREKWVTEELKKHFFKKPEYEGHLYAAHDDETTAGTEEEAKLNDKMTKDVKQYVEELREWEREANMRVSMIKKDFILEAFERADADDPPALRLWWEYLHCVDWREDFYDLLVTLQSREPRQYLN